MILSAMASLRFKIFSVIAIFAAILPQDYGQGDNNIIILSGINNNIIFLHAAEGVYLSLKGAVIVNNSCMDVADIGKYDDTGGDAALYCHTNKNGCCNTI